MPVIDTLDFHYFRINIAASSSYRIGFLMQTLEPSVGNIASAFSVNIIGTEEVKSSSWILLSYFTTQLKSIHNRHFDVAYYEIVVMGLELFERFSRIRESVDFKPFPALGLVSRQIRNQAHHLLEGRASALHSILITLFDCDMKLILVIFCQISAR